MSIRNFSTAALAMVLAASPAFAQDAPVAEPAAKPAPAKPKIVELYAAPHFNDVRSRAIEWVASRGISDAALLDRIGRLWAVGEDEVTDARFALDKVIETFALADPEAKKFLDACAHIAAPLVPPEADLLDKSDPGDFDTANLRLHYARYLAQRKMYDEALEQFEQIDPKATVDPASCLFYRAVCEHELLRKEAGLATIEKLLKNTENVPVAYSTVATLMQADLEALSEKTLDSIARQMRDSERRLELARSGPRVQKVQDEIIAELDELIKKLEEQGGGGGGGGDGQSNSNQSSAPANDSQVKGNTAPGEVDKKNFKNEAGWGDLPEKDQAKAKNLIGREFPAHYRQAVEEYFKKLANRRANSGR